MTILEAFLVHSHNQPPPRLSPPFGPKENHLQAWSQILASGDLGCIWRQRRCLGTYFQSNLVSTLPLPANLHLENWIKEAKDSVSPIALEPVCGNRTGADRSRQEQGVDRS